MAEKITNTEIWSEITKLRETVAELKVQTANNAGQVETLLCNHLPHLQDAIDNLRRYQYMLIGGLLVAQFVFPIILKQLKFI